MGVYVGCGCGGGDGGEEVGGRFEDAEGVGLNELILGQRDVCLCTLFGLNRQSQPQFLRAV